jgi:probable O-glycosylation ligase (exosortase A-associated)
MINVVVALAILGTLPAIVLRPHLGVLVWFWIAFMNPHRLTWGFAFDTPFAMMVAVVTLGAWLVSREPKTVPWTVPSVLLVAMAGWITLTTVSAEMPEAAWTDWRSAIKILVMSYVTAAMFQTRERLHALIWVVVISLGFYAFKGGLFTVLTGGQHHVFGPPHSFLSDNNQLAMHLLVGLPLMVYLLQQTKNAYIRAGLVGVTVLGVFAIVGSQSRGAFLALVCAGVFLLRNAPHRLKLGAAALVSTVVVMMFLPAAWYERMATILNYQQNESAMSRLEAWTFAYKVAVDRPIVGGGFGIVQDSDLYLRLVPEADTVFNFHSIYFEMLGNHGFIGLGLFVALGLATFLSFGRTAKAAADDPSAKWARDLGRMGQVSVVAFGAAGAFLNAAFFDVTYLLPVLSAGLHAAGARERAGAGADRAGIRRRSAGRVGANTAIAGARPPAGAGKPLR